MKRRNNKSFFPSVNRGNSANIFQWSICFVFFFFGIYWTNFRFVFDISFEFIWFSITDNILSKFALKWTLQNKVFSIFFLNKITQNYLSTRIQRVNLFNWIIKWMEKQKVVNFMPNCSGVFCSITTNSTSIYGLHTKRAYTKKEVRNLVHIVIRSKKVLINSPVKNGKGIFPLEDNSSKTLENLNIIP